jgi:hypothetical protein
MVDSDRNAATDTPQTHPARERPVGSSRRWRLVLALCALVVFAAGGAWAAYWWTGQPRPSEAGPLTAELTVLVRPPARASESLAVEEAGALPAHSGGQMSLTVRFNQPALTYLVWIDPEGQVVPLYPWNHDSLEVRDVGQPPPTRRDAKIVFSPPFGMGWRFGKKGGMETVLLLARRTHLDKGARLATLLGDLPPARPRPGHPAELAVLQIRQGEGEVSTLLSRDRGEDAEAVAAEQPLRALLVRLRDHFELVQAVRFVHKE